MRWLVAAGWAAFFAAVAYGYAIGSGSAGSRSVLALVGPGAIAFAPLSLLMHRQHRARTVRVEGTVTECENLGPDSDYRVTVRFTPDGGEPRDVVEDRPGWYRTGRRIRLRHSPGNPADAQIEDGNVVAAVTFVALLLVGAATTYFVLLRPEGGS